MIKLIHGVIFRQHFKKCVLFPRVSVGVGTLHLSNRILLVDVLLHSIKRF